MIFCKPKKDSNTLISLFTGEIFLILIKVLLIIVSYLWHQQGSHGKLIDTSK